jgi:hypothetical protein
MSDNVKDPQTEEISEELKRTSVAAYTCQCGCTDFKIVICVEEKPCGAPDLLCIKCNTACCVHEIFDDGLLQTANLPLLSGGSDSEPEFGN